MKNGFLFEIKREDGKMILNIEAEALHNKLSSVKTKLVGGRTVYDIQLSNLHAPRMVELSDMEKIIDYPIMFFLEKDAPKSRELVNVAFPPSYQTNIIDKLKTQMRELSDGYIAPVHIKLVGTITSRI